VIGSLQSIRRSAPPDGPRPLAAVRGAFCACVVLDVIHWAKAHPVTDELRPIMSKGAKIANYPIH
jgi:uncharacterized OsmC-like protein